MNLIDVTGLIVNENEPLENSMAHKIKGTKTRRLEKIEKIKKRYNLTHGTGKRKKKKK